MKLKAVIAGLALVAGSSIFGAGAATASQTASAATAEADPGRRVCRRLQPTGSRLPERVCRTQREWDEIAQRTRNGMEEQSRQDTAGHNPESWGGPGR